MFWECFYPVLSLTFVGFVRSRQYYYSSSVHHGFHGVKNTVCLVSRPSRPPAMCPAFNLDVFEWTSSMECKLLPIVRYGGVAQHLLWNLFPSCVSLNGSKAQQFVARVLTILESCFVASFPDEGDPIRQWNCFLNHFGIWIWALDFWICKNCPICLSFSRVLMSYQCTDKFRDLGFPLVSVTVFIGGQVLPNSLMIKTTVLRPFTLGMLFTLILHTFLSNLFKKIFWFSVS